MAEAGAPAYLVLDARPQLGPGSKYRSRPNRRSVHWYHPHGDSAVYDAMVRMAQDFSLRYELSTPG